VKKFVAHVDISDPQKQAAFSTDPLNTKGAVKVASLVGMLRAVKVHISINLDNESTQCCRIWTRKAFWKG